MFKLNKLGLLVISVLGLVFLVGCSSNNVPKIDEHTWELVTVQSREAEGQVIAYSSDNSDTFENAVEVNLECTAKNGEISLIDKMQDNTYSGSYDVLSTDRQSLIYKIIVDGTEGTGVSSMTTYSDENQTPTFIVSLGDYTLNFMAK